MNLFIWNARSKDGRLFHGVCSARGGREAREEILEGLKDHRIEIEDFELEGVRSKSFQIREVNKTTDQEVFLNMLRDYRRHDGIYLEALQFKISKRPTARCIISGEVQDQIRDFQDVTVVTVGEGCGFSAFFTEFLFDKDGRFLLHGVWE